jgi:hypothetical protein
LTLRRCPSGHGKSLEAQRPSPLPCGAARTLYHGASCARSFAATRPPPMAQWHTSSALVVPVLAARTDGGGIHAATRRSGVSTKRISRWQERLSGGKTPGCCARAPPVSAPAQCRGRARDARQDACGSGRVTRMDHGVEGSGDTFAVGQALWTARPHEVSTSEGARVSGHRANR